MPWKGVDVENLRYEFVLRSLQNRIPFRSLCREYGIEAKTGYKWQRRFLEEGRAGLEDRSRRPQRHAQQLTEDEICQIVRLKEAHESWGARKLREVYGRQSPNRRLPSESSFKRVLEKSGKVKKRKRRRSQDSGRLQNRASSQEPNDIWTVDLKGWWRTADGQRCEPLTVRDDFSCYLLCAAVPENGGTQAVRREFERIFDRHGLPRIIRSDNGSPFAATRAPFGLSRLSAWWLALGIDLDRIDPGCPSQNGRHERMHRDLAVEVEGRCEGNLRQQVAALQTWRRIFNEERPHEALGMRCPAEVYCNSKRSYAGTPDQLEYPLGYRQRKVDINGSIKLEGIRIHISQALVGWNVGLKPLKSTSLIYFGQLCMGEIDLQTESFFPTRGGEQTR